MDIYSSISNIYKSIKRCRHLHSKQEMSNKYVGKQASQQQITLIFLVMEDNNARTVSHSINFMLYQCACHISCQETSAEAPTTDWVILSSNKDLKFCDSIQIAASLCELLVDKITKATQSHKSLYQVSKCLQMDWDKLIYN